MAEIETGCTDTAWGLTRLHVEWTFGAPEQRRQELQGTSASTR
jgi:hypothetical protein